MDNKLAVNQEFTYLLQKKKWGFVPSAVIVYRVAQPQGEQSKW